MVKVIQISVGGFDNNFSYLILGEGVNSKKGILIDPTGNKDIIESEIKKYGAKILLQLFTHLHPDHIELLEHFKSQKIRSFSPAPDVIGKKEFLNEAGFDIIVLHTPGHTKESVCFIIENNIFSGDTIFAKGIGTTAYGGNDLELKETLNYLATLDKNLILWPGHDYGGASVTLRDALKNSHTKPSDKILKIIKKKVADYEAGRNKKIQF